MIKLDVVISCIPLNQGGAGDYLNEIAKEYKNYKLIAPFFIDLNYPFINKISLGFQTIGIRMLIRILTFFNGINKLVIHHPQSISYKYALMLINSANQIDYWVIDASFFCKKSYNHRNKKTCTNCLESYNPFEDCNHFPRRASDINYISFLDAVKKNINKINFIVQTEGYNNLVLRKYGYLSRINKKKMIVSSFFNIKNEELKKNRYDFGFHANAIEAKGSFYYETLTEAMKDYIFFMPDKQKLRYSKYKNLITKNLRWENGLKDELLKCKILLCPSQWSYPVEAAIIKSMLLGKPVALIECPYSLSEELPDNIYIKLTGKSDIDSTILINYLHDVSALDRIGNNGKAWAQKYVYDRS